jgi:hypothetical protein
LNGRQGSSVVEPFTPRDLRSPLVINAPMRTNPEDSFCSCCSRPSCRSGESRPPLPNYTRVASESC